MSGNPNLLFPLRGVYIKRKNNSRRPQQWFASAYVTPTRAVAAWEFDEETEGQLEGSGAVRMITVKEARTALLMVATEVCATATHFNQFSVAGCSGERRRKMVAMR